MGGRGCEEKSSTEKHSLERVKNEKKKTKVTLNKQKKERERKNKCIYMYNPPPPPVPPDQPRMTREAAAAVRCGGSSEGCASAWGKMGEKTPEWRTAPPAAPAAGWE